VRGTELKKLQKLLDMNMPKEKILEEMKPNNRRGNGHKVPEGGISISEASRKYGIPHSTMSGWIAHGFIKVIGEGSKEKYIPEATIAKIAKKYKLDKGRGNRQILRISEI